ncbi:hypothetical protein EG330_10800 [Pectobacterium versatile]|nr:hypothetical protein EG330_10800 [Pectobacterium versatile]
MAYKANIDTLCIFFQIRAMWSFASNNQLNLFIQPTNTVNGKFHVLLWDQTTNATNDKRSFGHSD